MVSERLDVIHMILNASLMVQFVMLLLFLFSVASWAIILIKYFQIRKAYKESAFFVEYFWKSKDFSDAFSKAKGLQFKCVIVPGLNEGILPYINYIEQIVNLEEERRANRKFVELETRGESPAFIELVDQLGCEWAQSGPTRFKMVLPEGLSISQLFYAAAKADVQLRKLTYKRDSLEDIFLKAMGTENGRL